MGAGPVGVGRRSEEDVGEAGSQRGRFGKGDEVPMAANAVDDESATSTKPSSASYVRWDQVTQ